MIKFLKSKLNKFSKTKFILSLNLNSKILDIGCGNNSPQRTKSLRSDLNYTGIDIIDLQSENSFKCADRFVKSNSEDFIKDILKLEKFDAIICSHVIEHVENYELLIKVILEKLNTNGLLYLSYPNCKSVNFPNRKGTLNFYDDNTHVNLIDSEIIFNIINNTNCEYKYSISNKPIILWCIGLILEPIAALTKKNAPFGTTWAFYGFEDVFLIKKND